MSRSCPSAAVSKVSNQTPCR